MTQASEFNERFCEERIEERPVLFKNTRNGMVMDSTHIIAILNKDQVKFEEVERYYAPASYSVKYLRKLLSLIKVLDEYEKEGDMYIWLPRNLVYPAFIKVIGNSEKVYVIAPCAEDFNGKTTN